MYLSNRDPVYEVPEYVLDEFCSFKSQYKKLYPTSAEHDYRLSVFYDNIRKAEEENARCAQADFGITIYSDLTTEEFQKQFLGTKQPKLDLADFKQHKKLFSDNDQVTISN